MSGPVARTPPDRDDGSFAATAAKVLFVEVVVLAALWMLQACFTP